jgi:hypothetical protein
MDTRAVLSEDSQIRWRHRFSLPEVDCMALSLRR